MFTRSIETLADKQIANGKCRAEDRDIFVYGVSSAVEMALNGVTTVVIGALFGEIVASIVFLACFSVLRTYAGGFHMNSSLACYLFSTVTVALVMTAVKFTPSEYVFVVSIILLALSYLAILTLAPSDTPNKPLDDTERKRYKKRSIIVLVVETVLIGVLYLLKFDELVYVATLAIALTGFSVALQRMKNKIKKYRF